MKRSGSTPDPIGDAAGDDARASGATADAISTAMLDDPSGRRGGDDAPIDVQLVQARVAGALFGGAASATGLGRFRIIDRLGAGGMGVVYAAYDPELDRGVALKLVKVPAEGRQAALAEAKALARLSHPNVVPVFDVGVDHDHVYIVMELVRGATLRQWAEGRGQAAIVAAYRQAGEGLAAAHAARLVHRDFKPDNAVVGADQRVRVVDFGLACEADAAATARAAGTPGYMAPEQATGAAVTAAADQYSFCVALGRALAAPPGGDGAAPPLPRWIEAALERGCAPDPAQRFPSMRELLDALGRDPARVRRRRLLIAAIAAGGLGVFAAGRSTIERAEPCADGAQRLASTWSPVAQREALARLASLGGYGRALAPRLEQSLRDHATAWTAGYHDACVAHREGAQSTALLDRRTICLERGRAALGAVAALVTDARAETLPAVALGALALPDPRACGDVATLSSDVELPAAAARARVAALDGRVQRAQVQIVAGQFDAALAVATQAVRDARAVGYRPALASALLAEGKARMNLPRRRDAAAPLGEALALALAVGDDRLAIEAWARRAWVQGTTGPPAAALGGLDVVEGLSTRRPGARFERALLLNNVGAVERAAGHRDQARTWFARAIDAADGITGADAFELVNARISLALVTDDDDARDAQLAAAVQELTRLVGARHPETLQAQRIRALSQRSLATAAALLTATCPGFERAPLTPEAATCWAKLGDLRKELGDDRGAVAALARSIALGAELDPALSDVMPTWLLWQGQAAAAATRFRATLAGFPTQADLPLWRRIERAKLQLGLGRAHEAIGWIAAREALEEATAALAAIAREQQTAAAERVLARTRAELAQARAATGADRAAILELAEPAAAWLRAAGAQGDARRAVEALLAPR